MTEHLAHELHDEGILVNAVLLASPSLLQDRFRAGLESLEEWERLQILSTLQRVAGLMGAEQLDASPHLTPGEISPAQPPAQEERG